MNKFWWLFLSIFAPLIIVNLAVNMTFWFNIKPLRVFEFFYISSALLSGLFCFSRLSFRKLITRIVLWFIYLVTLSQVIFWGSMLTGCWHGACVYF